MIGARPRSAGAVPAAMSLLFTSLLAAWSFLSGLTGTRSRYRFRPR